MILPKENLNAIEPAKIALTIIVCCVGNRVEQLIRSASHHLGPHVPLKELWVDLGTLGYKETQTIRAGQRWHRIPTYTCTQPGGKFW